MHREVQQQIKSNFLKIAIELVVAFLVYHENAKLSNVDEQKSLARAREIWVVAEMIIISKTEVVCT